MIEENMIKEAKKNEEVCCSMLVECATVHPECHDDKTSRIDVHSVGKDRGDTGYDEEE